MQNFDYVTPTRLIFGEGVISELPAVMKPFGKRVLLTYGGGSIKRMGLYDKVKELLADFEIYELSGIQPNPKYDPSVLDGVKICKEQKIDVILAVGGGSVLDCSKAIAAGAKYVGEPWDLISGKVLAQDALPMVDILTLAATGSEYDCGGVISRTETNDKIGYMDPHLFPQASILDPTYTFTVPKKQIAAGCADAINHIMEQYFCAESSILNDGMMEAAFKSLMANGRKCIENPEDYTARSNLMWLSTMAENRIIKLGKKCDFECHQMEHQISAYTNCSHGCGLAVLHPVYYRHICQAGAKKFARFAENVWKIPRNGRTDEEMAEAGVEALADFIREIGLPTTLREVGVEKKEDLKEIADSCYLVDGSYKKMTHEEILEIFLECF